MRGRKPGTGQAPYASSVIQGPGLVFIGIIDYLQKYTLLKKLERFWKVIFRCKDRNGISDLPPDNYKNRIMERVIGKVLAFCLFFFSSSSKTRSNSTSPISSFLSTRNNNNNNSNSSNNNNNSSSNNVGFRRNRCRQRPLRLRFCVATR